LVKYHYVIDPFPQSHLVARHRVGKETAWLPSIDRVKERGHTIEGQDQYSTLRIVMKTTDSDWYTPTEGERLIYDPDMYPPSL